MNNVSSLNQYLGYVSKGGDQTSSAKKKNKILSENRVDTARQQSFTSSPRARSVQNISAVIFSPINSALNSLIPPPFDLDNTHEDSDCESNTPIKQTKTSGLTPLFKRSTRLEERKEECKDSPFSSPIHKSQPLFSIIKTPVKVKNLKTQVQKMTPNRTADRTEKESIEEGITALNALPTEQRDAKQKEILDIVKSRLSDDPTKTCIPLRKEDYDSFSVSWPKEVITALKKEDQIPYRVINVEHLLRVEISKKKLVGFHFCPKDHPQYKEIKILAIHPITGVFYGEFSVQDPKNLAQKLFKKSTFFPHTIPTEQALIDLIEKSDILLKEENRAIFKHRDYPFYMEASFRDNGLAIHSIFPLFEYLQYDSSNSLSIGGKEFSSEAILGFGKAAAKTQMNIKYQQEENTIVDIASSVPNFPVESGIYIKFSTSLLEI